MSAGVNRHPLGLPAGSIRAIIALTIAGSFVVHLFTPEPIPLYLYFLLALVPPFFTAHGTSISATPEEPAPLHLPRGLIRLLITLGTLGAVGYYLYLNHFDLEGLTPSPRELHAWPHYLLAMLIGLFVGMLVGKGPWRRFAAFQDIQAWISILALFALGIELVIDLIVRKRLAEAIDPVTWNTALISVLAFYFASRS